MFDDLKYVGWAGLSTSNPNLMRQQWAQYAQVAQIRWDREAAAEDASRLVERQARITAGVPEVHEAEDEREGLDGSGTPLRKEAWDPVARDLVFEHLYTEKLQVRVRVGVWLG